MHSDLKNDYLKSMDYCQDSIKRMASNSFKMKSWFLALFVALSTFYSTKENPALTDLILLLPFLAFVYLDAFYLRLERMFIQIFVEFSNQCNDEKINKRKPFDLRPSKEIRNEFSIWNVIFSASVGWFYFPLLVLFQGAIIFLSIEKYSYIYIAIAPIALLVLSCFFQKKTYFKK